VYALEGFTPCSDGCVEGGAVRPTYDSHAAAAAQASAAGAWMGAMMLGIPVPGPSFCVSDCDAVTATDTDIAYRMLL
jgi:hypothetical protein